MISDGARLTRTQRALAWAAAFLMWAAASSGLLTPALAQEPDPLSSLMAQLQLIQGDQITPAPDFQLVTLEGTPASLRDFQGKVILLNFWATWCPACRTEMPGMNILYKKFRGRGFEVVAVDLGEPPATVQGFVDQLKLEFPVLLDADRTTQDDYRVRAIPTSFILGRDQRVVASAVGPRDWASPEAVELFSLLLSQEGSSVIADSPSEECPLEVC